MLCQRHLDKISCAEQSSLETKHQLEWLRDISCPRELIAETAESTKRDFNCQHKKTELIPIGYIVLIFVPKDKNKHFELIVYSLKPSKFWQ